MKCIAILAGLLAASLTCPVHAQDTPPRRLDLAVTYSAARSLKANTSQNFWLQGGSIELGVNAFHGLGIAVDITGNHAGSIGNSGVPLSLVTATFGPRYRWHAGHKLSLYGQALAGEANGFGSLFPATGNAQAGANSLALDIGGGVDLALSPRFAVRALQASYVRTQLPNAVDNLQNSVTLGAGFVLRFR